MPAPKNQALHRLGEALRQERKGKGFSQEKLALEAEIDRAHMGNIERGEENVSLLTLMKISAVLGVKPSALLLKADL